MSPGSSLALVLVSGLGDTAAGSRAEASVAVSGGSSAGYFRRGTMVQVTWCLLFSAVLGDDSRCQGVRDEHIQVRRISRVRRGGPSLRTARAADEFCVRAVRAGEAAESAECRLLAWRA
eukprot:5948632-Pleurochrysis_carterae.AAC.3